VDNPTPSGAQNRPSEEQNRISQTVTRLRELILKGDFKGGERISELPLVEMLGVSRTPIRLALERLAHEGLIEPYPTGGFIIRTFTWNDVWDTIEIRGTLEAMATRFACERLSNDAEVNTLRDIQHEMDVLGDDPEVCLFPKFLELNEAFHTEIAHLAQSPILQHMLDKVFCLPFGSPSALVVTPLKLPGSPERMRRGREHHHLIIDAIANRNVSFAESIAQEHARHTRRILELSILDKDFVANAPGAGLIYRSGTDSIVE
jgi:GntR family transcriptional regulator of vanillate catabolism